MLSHSSVATGATGFIPTQFLVTEIMEKLFAVSKQPNVYCIGVAAALPSEKHSRSEKSWKKAEI